MLNIVRLRFIRIAQRHLSEARIWNKICGECDDLFGKRYANRKTKEHLQMVEFWKEAIENLHYKSGTWIYEF